MLRVSIGIPVSIMGQPGRSRGLKRVDRGEDAQEGAMPLHLAFGLAVWGSAILGFAQASHAFAD